MKEYRFWTILILLLVGPIIAGLFIVPAWLHARVHDEVSAIKAAGDPVSCAELAPKIADKDNGGILYQRALDIACSPQGKNDLDGCRDLLTESERLKNPKLWDMAEAYYKKYKKTLLIAEQASAKPECRYQFDWNNKEPMAIIFPIFASIRRFVQFTSFAVMIETRKGNMDEAVRWMKLDFAVSESVKDEPTIIAQLVRYACLAISCRSLGYMIDNGNLNEHQARELFDQLAAIDLEPGEVLAMKGERAMVISTFDNISKSGPKSYTWVDEYKAIKDMPYERCIPFPIRIKADELWYLQTMKDLAKNTSQPYRLSMNSQTDYQQLPRYASLSRIMLSNSRIQMTRDKITALLAGYQVHLALIAYRDRFGSYPTDLKQLRQKLGWKIPNDVFSGKDFIYKRQGKGFIFYGIGENLKDDHAKTVANTNSDKYPYPVRNGDRSADMIWQMKN